MKIGLKLFPDSLDLVKKFDDLFDFFEVYVTPDMDLSRLRGIRGPLTIHAAHIRDGFDPANPGGQEKNTRLVQKAKDAAEMVSAPWIILHPGLQHNEGTWEDMVSFLSSLDKDSFVIENMPSHEKDTPYFCAHPGEMEKLMEETGLRCMLDFSHAICSATYDKEKPQERIKRFMRLQPVCFHLSGINEGSTVDMHKHLFEVHNDYNFLQRIPDGSWITLETNKEHMRERGVHEKNVQIVKEHIKG